MNELVTNCFVHAPGSTVRVRLIEETTTRTLTCVVCDDDPGWPVIRTDTEPMSPVQLKVSGYGIDSVAVLAARVECWPCVHGKAVGFQYRTPRRRPSHRPARNAGGSAVRVDTHSPPPAVTDPSQIRQGRPRSST